MDTISQQIIYHINHPINAYRYAEMVKQTNFSHLIPNEPIILERMLNNSNLTVSAWWDQQMVGVLRAVTDFTYCCYISELIIEEQYQKQSIGKELLKLAMRQISKNCHVYLLATKTSSRYYNQLGFKAISPMKQVIMKDYLAEC